MATDRIARLQSLLERIRKNAASPKRSLGSNLFSGGTGPSRSDVATGPAVPAASLAQSPARTDVAVRAPLPPVASAPHQPVSAPRTPTLAGAARVPTLSGGTIATPRTPEVETKSPAAPEVIVKSPASSEVIEELDFDDAGIVDITSDRPPPAEISSVEVSHVVSVEQGASVDVKPAADSDVDDLRWTEPPTQDRRPPDSSPRPITAASLDEALAEAADAESAAPIKTPPPESGRQPLEYSAPMGEPAEANFNPVPTAEQLGETLELEAPTSAEIELDLITVKARQPKEELELELPPRASELEPPPREETPTLAQQTSDAQPRHRAPEQSQILNLPEEVDTVETPAIAAESAEPSTDRDNPPLTPELTARKARGHGPVAEFVFASRKFAPSSFAELLDASLKLGN